MQNVKGYGAMTRLAMCISAIATYAVLDAQAVVAGESDAAEIFAAECAQCHGRTARGMASFPSLRGKSAEYLSDRLHSYRAGEAVGPNSMLMYPVAGDLDDKTITLLSDYLAETYP